MLFLEGFILHFGDNYLSLQRKLRHGNDCDAIRVVQKVPASRSITPRSKLDRHAILGQAKKHPLGCFFCYSIYKTLESTNKSLSIFIKEYVYLYNNPQFLFHP